MTNWYFQIPFTLKEDGDITLAVHDLAGRRIAVLAEGFRSKGSYHDQYKLYPITGIYPYTLTMNGRSETHAFRSGIPRRR